MFYSPFQGRLAQVGHPFSCFITHLFTSISLLEEGRTSPSRPTGTTRCLTTEMTVADPGALAGHPQLKAPGQHATLVRSGSF